MVGCYIWDADQRLYGAAVLDVLTLHGDLIAEVTGFTLLDSSPASVFPTALRTEDRLIQRRGFVLGLRL